MFFKILVQCTPTLPLLLSKLSFAASLLYLCHVQCASADSELREECRANNYVQKNLEAEKNQTREGNSWGWCSIL